MPQTTSPDWQSGSASSETPRRTRQQLDSQRNHALKMAERHLWASRKAPDSIRLSRAIASLDKVLELFQEAV